MKPPRKRKITPRRNPARKRFVLYAADDRKDLAVTPECMVIKAASVTELRAHKEWSIRPCLVVDTGVLGKGGRIVASNALNRKASAN